MALLRGNLRASLSAKRYGGDYSVLDQCLIGGSIHPQKSSQQQFIVLAKGWRRALDTQRASRKLVRPPDEGPGSYFPFLGDT